LYSKDETEEEASSSRLAAALVSENQEATEVPEAMVIEKRLPDLLSLLESHARTITSKILVVPRPPTPIPPPLPQSEPIEKKGKGTKKEGKALSRRAKSRKILLLSQPRWLSRLEPNKGGVGTVWKQFSSADIKF